MGAWFCPAPSQLVQISHEVFSRTKKNPVNAGFFFLTKGQIYAIVTRLFFAFIWLYLRHVCSLTTDTIGFNALLGTA